MAKRSSKNSDEALFYKNKDGRVLKAFSAFVYEVEVYVNIPGTYYLHDTITVKVDIFKKEGNHLSKIKNQNIIQCFTLLAAPKSWLEENKYLTTSLN